jgi:putative transposase
MPRWARLDAPGILHHVMARGIERRVLFKDRWDYQNFLCRIGPAREKAPVEILAWALMPNHIHFLLRSGAHGIAGFMRRVLTGYAVSFNQRHHRHGHLFQDRFKSLVCEEDPYLVHLVRYIHLNPRVAGIVKTMRALADYPYVGHGGLLGKRTPAWQSVDEVLGYFARSEGTAKRRYVEFMRDGLSTIQTTQELGGGIAAENQAINQRPRRHGERDLYDGRVLGEGEFVQQVWQQADRREGILQQLKRKGWDLRRLATEVSRQEGIRERDLFSRSRRRTLSRAKAIFLYAGGEYLGASASSLARSMQMSTGAASKARERGGRYIAGSSLEATFDKLIRKNRP